MPPDSRRDPVSGARAVVEEVARRSYGRLVARIAGRTRNIALAEDLLAHALERALAVWPERGVPASPEAWLLTAARNKWLDELRSSQVRQRAEADILTGAALSSADSAGSDTGSLPDDRLKLMFVCAHPAIDPAVRAPLMLQTVLGLPVRTIASAYLLPSPALSQRLVRAKRKILESPIRFEIPGRCEIGPRLADVLEAIYGAFSIGCDGSPGSAWMCHEALYLCDLLISLLPREPECWGLLALMSYKQARAPAETDPSGTYVPVSGQDPAMWCADALRRGAGALQRAAALAGPGRFQIEAALQAGHMEGRMTGATDWPAILYLYDILGQIAPTAGQAVARANAAGEVEGPAAGLAALQEIPAAFANRFQAFFAVRAYWRARSGDLVLAAEDYEKSISLCTDLPVRRWLHQQLRALAS